MADYLRTLAARALGDLPVVRPRQPSRFEPVISTDVGPLETLEVDELVAAAPPARGEPVTRRAAAPSPERPAAGTAVTARDSRKSPRDKALATRPPDARPLRITETRVSPVASTTAEAAPSPQHYAPEPADPTRQPQPTVRQAEATTPIAARRRPPTPQPGAPAVREPAAPVAKTDFVSHGKSDPLARAALAEVVERVAESGRDGSVETGTQRVTVVHQDFEELIAPDSDGSAPSITVSIGRIEVRASRPEPARTVARAPRPQPRMTLDAFLARQGRGR